MSPFSRFSFALARSVPGLSKFFNFALAPILRGSPRWILKLLASRLPAPDRAVLADPKLFAMFADSFREAFRQGGRGAAYDMTLYVQRWETRVESIRVPCHIWHGEQDTTVPVAMGRRLAAAVPGCRATFLPDEGHFSLPVRRMDEILSVLV
jgi:pimeloyl-ACP methyl ester carboxylesterase